MRWPPMKGKLITGVFDPETPTRGAAEALARVHFIAFTNNPKRQPDENGSTIEFVANPNIFPDLTAAEAAIATWPVQPATLFSE